MAHPLVTLIMLNRSPMSRLCELTLIIANTILDVTLASRLVWAVIAPTLIVLNIDINCIKHQLTLIVLNIDIRPYNRA